MKWSLRKKSKIKEDYLLALDIGTEFVKALILKVGENSDKENKEKKKGLVIGYGRERQSAGNMLAGAVADIDGVVNTCRKAIDIAYKVARVKPKRVVIGVAGEFIKGATTNFICKRSEPEKDIDSAEIQNIVQKIQHKAFNKMRSQLAWETCRPEIDIKPINALLTEIKIDGYKVTNPLGFQGNEIFLSVFNIYAPLVHLRALENIASKLGLELLSIAAESYALTKSSGFNPVSGAIFIDIGGGSTDIALVRQGKIEGIKSLSVAGRSFSKRLAQSLNLGFEEAEELKIKHAYKKISQNVQRKIRDILKRDVEIWLSGVELVLDEFSQKEPFPSLILLCGGGSLLPDIKNILNRESVKKKWLDKFSFNQPLQTSFIRSKHINNIVDGTNILKGPEIITPLALAGLALEIVSDEKKIMPPIFRRAIRMMR